MSQPPTNPYDPYQPPSGPGQPGVPYVPPDHPQAMTVLIMGVLGIALCQLLAPIAWVMGARAKREIAESGGRLGGNTAVTVGWALGLAGSILLIVVVAFFAVYAVVLIGFISTAGFESSSP